MSYVGAEPGLSEGYVRDVITLGRPARRDYVADLASVGLTVTPDTRWSNLSRGERQRVALVRALLGSPQLLVLDEPTSGLGTNEVDAVLGLLDRCGAGVLVATHDERVIAWCDRVVVLSDGVTTSR